MGMKMLSRVIRWNAAGVVRYFTNDPEFYLWMSFSPI